MDLGAHSLFKPQRRAGSYVRLVPPSRHRLPSLTGGLRRIYEKIKQQEAALPFDCEKYTNADGSFRPVNGMPLLIDRYEYVEVIGQGQSSILLKAKDMFQDGREVALKILHSHYSVLGSQEANCLQSLNAADPHRFSPILRLLTTFNIGRHFCLVFELLHCVPLATFFQQKKTPQERLRCIRKVALRLINAVGFLQSQNVIHADLKPDNLRLSEEGDLTTLKVVDFGNAIHCIHDELSLYYEDFEIQTLLYRAPEVIFGLMFGVEVDMWSVGCVLAELYVGQPLFHGRSMEAVLARMQMLLGPFPRDVFQRGKFFQTLEHFTKQCVKPVAINDVMQQLDCSDFPFVDFILRLLKFDPASRMTVDEAAEHPFLAAELGLKYFKLKPCYELNANYPKTFLKPETYFHSQKRPRRSGGSDPSLSQSTTTVLNLETLSLPKALKFLPQKIEQLSDSRIASKPDVIGEALVGLSTAEKSIRLERKSTERTETMDNNNGSIPRLLIKTEPVEVSPTSAEAEVGASGVGLGSMEISRTGQRSTMLDGIDRGFVTEESRIVNSDALEVATNNRSNVQQRRFNADPIHRTTSATECVSAGDKTAVDKRPNGFVPGKHKILEVLPKSCEAKDKRELGCVKLKNMKRNSGSVMVVQNSNEMPAMSLENGVCKMEKKNLKLLQATSSKKSPGIQICSRTSLPSLPTIDNGNKTVDSSDRVAIFETSSEALHSQPVLEELNSSSRSNGRSCPQMSQSMQDVGKRNGASVLTKDTASNAQGTTCTSLSDNLREILNRQKVGTINNATRTKDIFLLSECPQTATSKIATVDTQQNVLNPSLNLREIWQSLRQKSPDTPDPNKSSPTVSEMNMNASVEFVSVVLPVRTSDSFKPVRTSDSFKPVSGHKVDQFRALKKPACDPTDDVYFESVAILGEVEDSDSSSSSYPAIPLSSRELSGGSAHQPVEENLPRRLIPARKELERKSKPSCVGQQQSSLCDKRPPKNSPLDVTFLVEDIPSVKRTPVKMPLQAERIPPLQAERIPPLQAERIPPLQAERIPPLQAERIPPLQAERIPPLQAERIPPLQAERIPPLQAERIPPLQAERIPPLQAERIPPLQAERIPPLQAERIRPRKTVSPEHLLNSSLFRKKAKATNNCLDVTFSRPANPCKDKNIEAPHSSGFLSSTNSLARNSQKPNYAVPVVSSRKSFKSPRPGSSITSPNMPDVREKVSEMSSQQSSLSDCPTAPPKKRRKLQSETANKTVVLPTEPQFHCVNTVACSADGSRADGVNGSRVVDGDGKTPQRIERKKIAVRGGNVSSRGRIVVEGENVVGRNATVVSGDFNFCKSPLNETFRLDEASEVMEHTMGRWQHKQILTPGGDVKPTINRTNHSESFKIAWNCASKTKMSSGCYAGKGMDASDVDESDSGGELDRSGCTINKTSFTLVNGQPRKPDSASTVCLSADDDEEDDDEVVMLTP